MRQIKFRARALDNNEWCYGSLDIREDGYYIHQGFFVKVDPKTVGQYTGLKDRNGVEIYEGDVLDDESPDYDHSHTSECFDSKTKKEICDPNIHLYRRVVFDNGSFVLDPDPSHYYEMSDYGLIGNIYENPELLGKSKDRI